MAEMSIEQQRAIAIATARLRLQTQGDAPSTAEGVTAAFGSPQKEQPSAMSRIGNAAFSGSLRGGPIPAAISALSEGADIGNEALTRGAYEVGGAVTDITGSPGAGLFANALTQAAPSIASVPARVPSLLQAPARRLMQSAALPDKAMRESGKAKQALNAMLERDINATSGGLERAQEMSRKLGDKVDEILAKSSATVDPNDIALKTLKESLAKITYSGDPVKDMKVIDKSINTFLSHPQVEGVGRITVETANKLKQGIYKELDNAYLNVGLRRKSEAVETMTDKVRAANLRESVIKAEPAVAPTLAEQSELINIIKTIGPQVSREGNKKLVGLGWLPESATRTLAWMIERYPWFNSFLARSGYTAGKQLPAEGIATLQATQGQQ